jgi:hypothetical protein
VESEARVPRCIWSGCCGINPHGGDFSRQEYRAGDCVNTRAIAGEDASHMRAAEFHTRPATTFLAATLVE